MAYVLDEYYGVRRLTFEVETSGNQHTTKVTVVPLDKFKIEEKHGRIFSHHTIVDLQKYDIKN